MTHTDARVTLLTRTDCHLCESARAVVEEVCGELGEGWHEVNVDTDADLRSEYGDQVPVVLIDGDFFASLRLEAAELRAGLNRPV